MSDILGKLSSYQILTNLLPGAFFVWMLGFLFDIDVSTENVVENILTLLLCRIYYKSDKLLDYKACFEVHSLH